MTAGGAAWDRRANITGKVARKALHKTIELLNRKSDHYATYHERPKAAQQIGRRAEPALRRGRMAIVMQGPVMSQDQFTLETLRFYSREMPHCRMILSTWKDTPPEMLGAISKLGVDIILCDKPPIAGLFNINMQIVSASQGVQRAAESGAEWVLKTRTDQRLYDPHALAFLASLAETFPVRGTSKQKHRIIGIGQGTLKFAPYHVTDQTVFGHAEDMLTYWTPPLRNEPPPASWPSGSEQIFLRVPIGELCRLGAPESYFASSFLTRTARPLTWTLEDTWSAYRDNFCIVDYNLVDLFWVKSQTYTQREHVFQYDCISNREEMGFREWMLLYSGQIPVDAARRYEGVAQTCFNFDIPLAVDDPSA